VARTIAPRASASANAFTQRRAISGRIMAASSVDDGSKQGGCHAFGVWVRRAFGSSAAVLRISRDSLSSFTVRAMDTAPTSPTLRRPSPWVLLGEAAERGWGMLDTPFGREEFGALAAKARAAG